MFQKIKGYTMVELLIAIAIIASLTLALVGGYIQSTRNERFSGRIREFTNQLQEIKTDSYTGVTGSSCPNTQCYWRGVVLEADRVAQRYVISLLYGYDTVAFATTAQQQLGIQGKISETTYNFTSNGLVLAGLSVGAASEDEATIAFLSPGARSYSKNQIIESGSFNPNIANYTSQSTVVFVITDQESSLEATVTFEPSTGMISTSIN